MKRCLYCYQLLIKNEIDFHSACSKKIFGHTNPPELPYSESEMEELAKQVVRSHITVPGVQPKISLDLPASQNKNGPKKVYDSWFMGGIYLETSE